MTGERDIYIHTYTEGQIQDFKPVGAGKKIYIVLKKLYCVVSIYIKMQLFTNKDKNKNTIMFFFVMLASVFFFFKLDFSQ